MRDALRMVAALRSALFTRVDIAKLIRAVSTEVDDVLLASQEGEVSLDDDPVEAEVYRAQEPAKELSELRHR